MTDGVSSRGRWRLAGLVVVAAAIAVAGCEMPMPLVAPREPEVTAVRIANRAIVTLTSVDFRDATTTPWVRIRSHGGARASINGGGFVPIGDSLRVLGLRTAAFDVTDGDAHLDLAGPGSIAITARATGANAIAFNGEGRSIVLLRGGNGISAGPDDMPEPREQN